jgi:predicted membrane protein
MANPSGKLDPYAGLAGRERTIVFHDAATIGGAPVAFVVVLATVVAVLSFIPFSIVLSGGSSFPMAQGVYSFNGWMLGPWAGFVASAIGSLVGVFLAPHTAGIPWLSVTGAGLAALYAASLKPTGRQALWLLLSVGTIGGWTSFYYVAVHLNGVDPAVFIVAYLTHIFSTVLFLSPARTWIGRLIASPDLRRVSIGVFFGTWIAASLMMFYMSWLSYLILTWPEEVFYIFFVMVPLENLARSFIGAIIGTGVIAGLRAMTLVKPPQAMF